MANPAYDRAVQLGVEAARELADAVGEMPGSTDLRIRTFLVAAHDQGLVVLRRDDVARWLQALEAVAATGCAYREDSPCEPTDGERSACDSCLALRALR